MTETLLDELAASYETHPAFRFDQPAWIADEPAMERFAAAYDAVRPGGGTADVRRCHAELSTIFGSLADQATDDHEVQFVAELDAASRRLLDDEIEVHRWRRRPADAAGPFDFDGRRHRIGFLPSDAVAEITDLGRAQLTTFRERAERGELTRDDLSVNTGPEVRAMVDVLNTAFGELGVLAAVSSYMARPMHVSGLAFELSVPKATWWTHQIDGVDRPPRTMYAHLDESIGFPKAIVYLTDVDEGSGPTSCYPGCFDDLHLHPLQAIVGRIVGNVGNGPDSPLRPYYSKAYHQSTSSEPFRRHFMRLPLELRFNSHFGWDVLPGSAIEEALVRREVPMLGPAGTFLAFDGSRLIHRGGMAEIGDRVALQVIFSPRGKIRRVVRKLKVMRR